MVKASEYIGLLSYDVKCTHNRNVKNAKKHFGCVLIDVYKALGTTFIYNLSKGSYGKNGVSLKSEPRI